jgi:hypothetical protein
MGHTLMDRVARDWGDLPGNAYKCLMVMASCALDDADQPVYFGGWERLALQGMGKRDWPADDDDSPAATARRKSYFEVVRIALADLRRAGAIESRRRGRPGVRAEFTLTLQRNLVSAPKETLEATQRSLADRQTNLGAHYQHSQQLTRGENTSPSGVRHQGAGSAVDKARSSSKSLDRARAHVDEGAA